MTIFITVLLAVMSLVFIAIPFLKQKGSSVTSNEDEKRELHSRQNTTYAMLKELEFDLQSGLMTEQDYRDLEVRYKRKAISILKDADNMGKAPEVNNDIEEQIKKLRLVKKNASAGQQAPVAKNAALDQEVEEEVQKLRRAKSSDTVGKSGEDTRAANSKGKFCPKCGTKSEEDDLFCSSCGTRLK